jgi:hypothetical protein
MTITELIEQWEKKHTQGMSEIVSLYETKKLTIKAIFSAMFETTNESSHAVFICGFADMFRGLNKEDQEALKEQEEEEEGEEY